MLPHDAKARKAIPMYTFLTQYFPDAIAEMVKVSVAGNEQHNPGQPLHWARGKSTDQLDAAMRHLFDHGAGIKWADGQRTLAQAAWRLLAQLQLDLEKETSVKVAGAAIDPPPSALLSPNITVAPLPGFETTDTVIYETPRGPIGPELILRLESTDPDTIGDLYGSVRAHQERGNAQRPGESAGSPDHSEGYFYGSQKGAFGGQEGQLR